MSLRLQKLPDRKPVKLTLSLDPDLAEALSDYARIYEQAYGAKERAETLAPHMIEGFLAGDTAFKRARKLLHQRQTKE